MGFLTDYEVAVLIGLSLYDLRLQTIFAEFCIFLVVLVVAESVGIVKYSIPTKILVEEMFVENLGVVLGVVICLVVVVVHISCGILILS